MSAAKRCDHQEFSYKRTWYQAIDLPEGSVGALSPCGLLVAASELDGKAKHKMLSLNFEKLNVK